MPAPEPSVRPVTATSWVVLMGVPSSVSNPANDGPSGRQPAPER